MLVPLSLIKKWITPTTEIEQIAEKLTLSGLEVDAIDPIQADFSGVRVAKVIKTEPHPNAEKLQLVTLTDGQKEFVVVCGDLNCKEGMFVAFAGVGAVLKLSSKKPIQIKSCELRGVTSPGMLASSQELSLPEESNGICILDDSIKLGTDFATLVNDTVLDIALTPNLGHCMSSYGVARQIATLFDLSLKKPKQIKLETAPTHRSISDKQCASYLSFITLENVEVAPSPYWLKTALNYAGIRSINNIVDATNFVMLELGQPMHAYDKDTLDTGALDVALLTKETPFHALDDEKYTLREKSMVVMSGSRIVAIAGVMGSFDSQVTTSTKNIVLEAAHFSAAKVRFSSKALNLRTEASNRFEKGVDPCMVEVALAKAAKLILDIAGGKITHWSRYSGERSEKKKLHLHLHLAQVNTLLGTHLSLSEVETIFDKLFFKTVLDSDGKSIHVTVPSYRNDIEAEIDLIEEVAIVYGYEHIEKKQTKISLSQMVDCPDYKLEKNTRSFMTRYGLQELLPCSLISQQLAKIDAHRSDQECLEPIGVLMPGSHDQSVLRASLLPGLLTLAKHNIDHNNHDLQGFEVGKIHFNHQGKNQERLTLGILMLGKKEPFFFGSKNQDCDFFSIKGCADSFLHHFAHSNYSLEKESLSSFHPNNQQSIFLSKGGRIGILGQLHPKLCAQFSIKGDVFYAEIDLQSLVTMQENQPLKVSPPPLFPASSRDWTLPVNKSLSFAKLNQTLKDFPSTELEKFQLIDVYTGPSLPDDQKNLTLRFTYRSSTRTLTQEMVDKEHAQLVHSTSEKLKEFMC